MPQSGNLKQKTWMAKQIARSVTNTPDRAGFCHNNMMRHSCTRHVLAVTSSAKDQYHHLRNMTGEILHVGNLNAPENTALLRPHDAWECFFMVSMTGWKILLPSARHLEEGRGRTIFELRRLENCISTLCPSPLGSPPPPPTPK